MKVKKDIKSRKTEEIKGKGRENSDLKTPDIKLNNSGNGDAARQEERLPLKVSEKRNCVWHEEEETISSSCFIQLVSQIQTTCARRATLSQDRMKRGAKRYLPTL